MIKIVKSNYVSYFSKAMFRLGALIVHFADLHQERIYEYAPTRIKRKYILLKSFQNAN